MSEHEPSCDTNESDDWKKDGACRGYPPDWWYPTEDHHLSREARDLCARCPVQAICYLHGMLNKEWGWWGGVSMKGRRFPPNKRSYYEEVYLSLLAKHRDKKVLPSVATLRENR